MRLGAQEFPPMTAPTAEGLSEENRGIWNRFGLVATNGVVSMSRERFAQALDAAREEGREQGREEIRDRWQRS